eukprot:1454317-Rhodomonas_salina.2
MSTSSVMPSSSPKISPRSCSTTTTGSDGNRRSKNARCVPANVRQSDLFMGRKGQRRHAPNFAREHGTHLA